MENTEQNQPTQSAAEASAPQEVSQPLTSEVKPKNRFLLPIFLSLFTLILGGGLVFAWFRFLKREKVLPQPVVSPSSALVVSPSPSPDVTVGWKTYRNEEYGFEINYPQDKEVIIDTEKAYMGICNLDGAITAIKLYNPGQARPKIETEFSGYLIVVVDIQSNPNNLEAREWFTKNCQGTWVVIDSTIEKIQIASVEGIKATGGSMGLATLVAVPKDQSFYFVYGWNLEKPDSSAANIFNQILSTFRFLD